MRNVIHIDVVDFHIAVERALEPRLRGRPVAVSIETAVRSLIFASSGEARRNGVYRGTPLHQARRLCPDLIVLSPNEALYRRVTLAMERILGRFSPVIEPLRFGHAYVDMSGTGRLFGKVKDAAARAQHEIREQLRLQASAGVASNKLVSKVASDVAGHSGGARALCDVRHGYEESFLAPLEVVYLPGVGGAVRGQLLDLNIRIIREVAAISAENLQMVFGRFGVLLHQRAHGIDNRPVQPPRRAPQIVEVERLQGDSNDFDLLRARAFRLLSNASRRLRLADQRAGRMLLKVRYADHRDGWAQQRIRPEEGDFDLLPTIERLLERAVSRRVRVRELALYLRDLAPAPRQMSLFEPAGDPRRAALTAALDRIRDRYGDGAVFFGRAA